jgi:hypothetical protein
MMTNICTFEIGVHILTNLTTFVLNMLILHCTRLTDRGIQKLNEAVSHLLLSREVNGVKKLDMIYNQ